MERLLSRHLCGVSIAYAKDECSQVHTHMQNTIKSCARVSDHVEENIDGYIPATANAGERRPRQKVTPWLFHPLRPLTEVVQT